MKLFVQMSIIFVETQVSIHMQRRPFLSEHMLSERTFLVHKLSDVCD